MRTARIVIADGDVDSRYVYRMLLQYHGHEVRAVADGAAAWAAAASWPAEVVVSELTLPSMSGHELVERLRADERTKGACIIVLTARGLQEDRERAERAGCTSFMTKPLQPQALVRLIEQLTGEQE